MLNTSHSIEAWTFCTDTVMSKQIIVSDFEWHGIVTMSVLSLL